MKTFTIVAVVAALASPVYAQGLNNNPQNSGKPGMKSDQEKAEEAKQRKLEDKAYKDSLSRIPDREKEKKVDPWGNVR